LGFSISSQSGMIRADFDNSNVNLFKIRILSGNKDDGFDRDWRKSGFKFE
jgi:hypothetical protein